MIAQQDTTLEKLRQLECNVQDIRDDLIANERAENGEANDSAMLGLRVVEFLHRSKAFSPNSAVPLDQIFSAICAPDDIYGDLELTISGIANSEFAVVPVVDRKDRQFYGHFMAYYIETSPQRLMALGEEMRRLAKQIVKIADYYHDFACHKSSASAPWHDRDIDPDFYKKHD